MYKILSNVRKVLPVFPQTRGAKCCKPCPEYQCPRKPKEEEILYVVRHWVTEKPKKYNAVKYERICLFISAPLIIGYAYYLFYALDHEKRRPMFKPYDHMRIRRKPFKFHEDPNKSLFHDSYYNALPDGYEYEVPPEEEYDPEELFKNKVI